MRQILVIAGLLIALGAVFANYADRSLKDSAARETPVMAAATTMGSAPSNSRTVVIPRDSRGHFQVNGRVDGKQMALWSTPAPR